MNDDPVVRDYLALGLRLGRLVDGFVDCWFGDPQLARQIEDEPLSTASALIDQAKRLHVALADSGLSPQRQSYLSAQVQALECSARRLAGEEISFLTEVERYFEVPVAPGDPERYAAVHDEIDELLPGPGDLQSRVDAFYDANAVPPDRLEAAVRAVSAQLRARTLAVFPLPERERIEYEVVTDRPWNAFNRYHGDFRSVVTLNAEAGRAIGALPLLISHESYPGHHTEHCVKEATLVRGRGETEHAISLVNTPQCLMAEGTAEVGVTALLGAGWGAWTEAILADHGVTIDGPLVERMVALVRELLPARQDAAILLHDRGADLDTAADYLRRWLLLPEDRARHIAQFLADPLWRAYSVTYVEGARLVGEWLSATAVDGAAIERYRRLLAEQLLPSTLRAELNRVEVP
ncbi:DUF885 domain-containing protein [Micromonospora sp. NPDC003776]